MDAVTLYILLWRLWKRSGSHWERKMVQIVTCKCVSNTIKLDNCDKNFVFATWYKWNKNVIRHEDWDCFKLIRDGGFCVRGRSEILKIRITIQMNFHLFLSYQSIYCQSKRNCSALAFKCFTDLVEKLIK